MLGFQGPAQPSPALGDAINAGFGYLEVKCLGCNTHQTVALDIVRRPKATPVHELERYMRCKDCSRGPGLPYKRSHLVALRVAQDHGERSAVNMVAGRAMTSLPELIPNVDFLLEMEAEELAATMLPVLAGSRQQAGVILGNYCSSLFSPNSHGYDNRNQDQIILAVTEAWNWLEVQGLLIPAPGGNGSYGWRVLSRKAEKLASSAEVQQFAKSRHLRREILNPRIADKVWSAFIRSEYDVAVFQAMKAVEVAVREASGLGAEELGVKLMRKAFNVEDGPLTDMTAEMGERQACSDLFAGAIGSYKNSHSHRDVNLNNPDEAHELVMLANHLLRIVDQRRSATK